MPCAQSPSPSARARPARIQLARVSINVRCRHYNFLHFVPRRSRNPAARRVRDVSFVPRTGTDVCCRVCLGAHCLWCWCCNSASSPKFRREGLYETALAVIWWRGMEELVTFISYIIFQYYDAFEDSMIVWQCRPQELVTAYIISIWWNILW